MRRIPGDVNRRHDNNWRILLLLTSWIVLTAASGVSRGQVIPGGEPSRGDGLYDFQVERGWLAMGDGVRLSVTYFRPLPRTEGEKFPALLELLPYRKDDQFYRRDYPLYSYFSRRGYVMAKVDVRGTGSSEGAVPDREYSEAELNDAVEIIDQLSKEAWSNGRVGMWGISWGGFNAIQVAMRKPPALEAILAMDASDDLYKDDVHFIDGIFHVDEYELSIDHDLGLPRSPDYLLDQEYFRDRFDRYPWFLTYLKQQRDGEFWRKNSLRFQYESLSVPAYLIGGLLDGYRDSIPRMLAHVKAPLKAVIGPWNHAFPDDGVPGPNFEWRQELVRWWDYWLKGVDTGIQDDPRFAIFVRDSHPPDPDLAVTPGQWRYEEWPIRRTRPTALYPDREGGMQDRPINEGVHHLRYSPGSGVPAGFWWGEATPDMRPADAESLVYDSRVLGEKLEIVGFPQVRLRVSADAELAHWVVRLEDVWPDGRVTLVTGSALNGSQRTSRLSPEPLRPGGTEDLSVEMHFTTWTFQPGHRIRLAVSNGLFPMFWPVPHLSESRLWVGSPSTCLILPVIPPEGRVAPDFLPSEPREERADAFALVGKGWPALPVHSFDPNTETTMVDWYGENNYSIRGIPYFSYEKTHYQTNQRNPADSRFEGEAGHRIQLPGREIRLKTSLQVTSDAGHFHVLFRRELDENGRRIRTREWRESVPRDFQ